MAQKEKAAPGTGSVGGADRRRRTGSLAAARRSDVRPRRRRLVARRVEVVTATTPRRRPATPGTASARAKEASPAPKQALDGRRAARAGVHADQGAADGSIRSGRPSGACRTSSRTSRATSTRSSRSTTTARRRPRGSASSPAADPGQAHRQRDRAQGAAGLLLLGLARRERPRLRRRLPVGRRRGLRDDGNAYGQVVCERPGLQDHGRQEGVRLELERRQPPRRLRPRRQGRPASRSTSRARTRTSSSATSTAPTSSRS